MRRPTPTSRISRPVHVCRGPPQTPAGFTCAHRGALWAHTRRWEKGAAVSGRRGGGQLQKTPTGRWGAVIPAHQRSRSHIPHPFMFCSQERPCPPRPPSGIKASLPNLNAFRDCVALWSFLRPGTPGLRFLLLLSPETRNSGSWSQVRVCVDQKSWGFTTAEAGVATRPLLTGFHSCPS